uniref:Uncharacterized protein n=1 Tax=Anguilla anguilla TaxID=7936 RepID=A0A0E9VSW1_ANGAN
MLGADWDSSSNKARHWLAIHAAI